MSGELASASSFAKTAISSGGVSFFGTGAVDIRIAGGVQLAKSASTATLR